MNSGDAYLNVHNVPNPMGVIRGQARTDNCCIAALPMVVQRQRSVRFRSNRCMVMFSKAAL